MLKVVFRSGAYNMARTFVYIPLIAYSLAKLFRLDYKTYCDLIAPYPLLVLGINLFGCMFAGCCAGYPCDFGYFNPITEVTTFPNHILEAVVILIIIVWLIAYSKRNDYHSGGKIYPMMLAAFGCSRFFLEFLRDNEKIVLGISEGGFQALFCGIVGTVVLHRLTKQEKKRAVAESIVGN